jgi:polyhydroxyalkanoate synthesis regulator phasin
LNEDIVSDNKIRYKLKINDKLWPLLSLIFDLQEALGDDNFLDYSWGGGLSTGEEAYLTHFARLYDLIVGKNKINFEHPILLMIDEGDLYFHPEWQKKYFSELLKYIKFLFPKNKVQIILTTHSPFIASDLPKQNLIFLEQDADGKCIVINNDISFETFGSNIHELYTNSFFLKGGLIGEFAKKQIQEIFDWYKTPSTEGHIQVRNKISIIGEQIIRVKLSEMYASKMNENIEESRLNEQINILKNKLSYYEKSK